MCLFVESLRIENGEIYHLPYHNERFNRTRREVFGLTDTINLADYIVPEQQAGLQKCRVLYKENILEVEISPYQMRTVCNLKVIECDGIDYHYKSADREALNRLFEQRGECDDILIVRNGLVTDTYAANIAFFDGKQWYTPAKPLLAGTNRAFLLEKNLILPKDISLNDIFSYQSIRLFNAMIDFGQIEFSVDSILL